GGGARRAAGARGGGGGGLPPAPVRFFARGAVLSPPPRQHLSDDQISVIVWIATTIGAFNRVSILSKHPVRARKENADMTDTAETTVTRNADKSRYDIFYGGELAGFAEYVERGEDTDFVHTEIDKAFGGKGLGTILAERALDDTVARGRTIIAHCPFIKAFIDKHPKYDPHVVGKGIKR
ncbi:GNAT family N-acetyltransferase, partial [Nocardia farcinica]|uniref:GNAT family N-acetyltransferase n=1 Tax=Nocardia farcinica TaxID=37329 RepID=UPI0024540FF2